jgi:glutathione S-transferase
MLRIYGRATSSNTQMVMWCAGELGLACERIDVGGPFGGTDTPTYRALNPNGLIPTIDDDGFVLWESNAIIRYLAAKYGMGTLCPVDLQERASADRWMDWQLGTVDSAMWPAFRNLIRTPAAQRNAVEVADAEARLARYFGLLDDWLANKAFMAGGRLTMGDIPLGMMTWRYFQLALQRPDLPNVAAWCRRLEQRPAYRTHVMLPLV